MMRRYIVPLLAMILMISLCSCVAQPGRPGESSTRDDRTEPVGTLGTGTTLPAETTVPQTSDGTTETSGTQTTEPPLTTDAPTETVPPETKPPVTEPPKTDTVTTQPPAPQYPEENSGIVWTVGGTPLFTDEAMTDESAALEADTAVLLLEKGDGFCRIATLGGKYYVRTEMLTDVLPDSAAELMAENGGVYYKGVMGLVAIDAGHQGKGMNGKEPLGPGSETLKKMLSTGTQGVATRIPEYVLNLEVSLRLRNELISRGYGVVMIRESHSVTLSNSQRAKIANAYRADIFIRVHANGSTDRTVRGAYGICMTKNNQFNAELHDDSLRLSECIGDEICRATGVVRKKTWQTDTMTGINWSEVPVTIIEMGYMSNPDEDRLMATDEFRNSAAVGIANGVDRYFAGQ